MMRRVVLAVLLASMVAGLSGCLPLVAAGGASAALVATDRRTSGAYVDDQAIELKAEHQIAEKLPSAHVNVSSYNRVVLLTGEVPNEEAKSQALLIARSQPNVRNVYDYTTIGPVSSLSERSNDVYVATKVRTRLLDGKGFPPGQVKVVTERGVVYLMGLLTQAEGEAAAAVVSQTSGVQKVVTLFEVINPIQ
jgi:osmotically-inducible protein OsmY